MDRMVRTPEEFNHILLYIQQNAIETGVRHPDDYPWYWRESAQPGRCATTFSYFKCS